MTRQGIDITELRKAELYDSAKIADIYNYYIQNSTATFDTLCISPVEMELTIKHISGKYPFICACVNGDIIGYCYAHPWKEKAAYARTLETTIYLHPEHCDSGIGKTLMEKLISECRNMGIRVLIACVTSENEGSIRFHKKLGFREVSHFYGVGEKFDRLLDVTDLQLNL